MEFNDLNLLTIGNEVTLTGAVWSGNGQMLVCLFPDAEDDAELSVLRMGTEEWKALIRQSDLLETEALVKGADGKLKKAIVRKSERNIEQGVSWNVFRRDECRCRYCGSDTVPLTVDHLVLWEDGGPSTEANLVSACRKCNKRRGNTQYADWLKHPFYLEKSKRLTPEVRAANEAILGTLDAIPRVVGKRRSR
jgi:hypothetical protein